jgi:hypothetical protein
MLRPGIVRRIEAKIPAPLRWLAAPLHVLRYALYRPVRSYLAATAATGALLNVAPGMTSRSLDGHMAETGHPEISRYFSTANIRVYDYANPLQVPHVTVFALAANPPKSAAGVLTGVFKAASLNFDAGLSYALGPLFFSAYSISDHNDFADRRCFIRPLHRADIDDYLNDMTGFSADAYAVKGGRAQLASALYTYVMAHEARHCDQDKNNMTGLLEGDADTYAMRVVRETHGTEIQRELHDIIRHWRTLNAAQGGSGSHTTSPALARETTSLMHALYDKHAYQMLAETLRRVVAENKDSLKGLSRTEQYYHAAQALLRDDILRDPLLASAARHYIASVDYFNDRAGGGQIGRLPAMTRLDVAFVNGPAAMPPSRIPAPNA